MIQFRNTVTDSAKFFMNKYCFKVRQHGNKVIKRSLRNIRVDESLMYSSWINCSCNHNMVRYLQLSNNKQQNTRELFVSKHEEQEFNTVLNNTNTMGYNILLKTRRCVMRCLGNRISAPSFWPWNMTHDVLHTHHTS